MSLLFDLPAPQEAKRISALVGFLRSDYSVDEKKEAKLTENQSPLPSFLKRKFELAGISPELAQKRTFLLLSAIAPLLLVALLSGSLSIGGVAVVLVCIGYFLLNKEISARSLLFERDYTAFLLSLASSLRTGRDPLSALLEAPRLFSPSSVVRSELENVVLAISAGASEDEAVEAFGKTVDHPDVKLFRTAFSLARKEGSALSETLARLARVTRLRQSFRRKVKGALAMQKFSSIGIVLCALILLGIQLINSLEAVQAALESPMGSKMYFIGGILLTLGVGWMFALSSSGKMQQGEE